MTRPGIAPAAIIGDTDVLLSAPLVMMAAGFGDVFGKITALMDWRMAASLLGEYRCETVAGTVKQAVDACMAAASGIPDRDPVIVERLMEALVLSGLAMQMVGDSRPASGCEHLVAHFFEMRDMAQGRHSALHGNLVGLGELIGLRLYEKLFAAGAPDAACTARREDREARMRRDLGPFADTITRQNASAQYYDAALNARMLERIAPDWDSWRAEAAGQQAARRAGEEHIRRAGGPVRAGDLGYSREEMRQAICYAMELRDKFTVLRLAQLSGRLEELAEELADEFR
jgi:glycerol-1-phosphate dehydrogenase [NAD(P)+]